MDAEAVRAAYRRWAGVYDAVFGGVCLLARRRAVALVNRLPGRDVLEVGVGTGLALPHYLPDRADHRHRPLGRDAGPGAQARRRPRASPTSTALHEMDAEATDFPDASFDIAVAMFVASVVPNPRAAAGGNAAGGAARRQHPVRQPLRRREGPALVDRARAWRRRRARSAGIRTSRWRRCSRPRTCAHAATTPVPPFGIFTLVRLRELTSDATPQSQRCRFRPPSALISTHAVR